MSAIQVEQSKIYTQDDLIRLDGQGYRFELIKGELIPMSQTSRFHGLYTNDLAAYVTIYVLEHDMGECYAAESGFLLARDPDTVLAPDFAFVRKERIAELNPDGFVTGPPDLVLETKSPRDSLRGLKKKMARWLEYGAKVGLLIIPEEQTLTVYLSGAEPILLMREDTLAVDDVLPGFSLQLTRLFR
ncbi:MAG TPA: Uma2 family endonuclease [Capsulimonadaceae bacterium]|jgi:Uma2 family endonuclease